jgi:hypothetical protein
MHPLVTCILPCRGRLEQTVTVATKLQSAAGDVPAEWWAVGGSEDAETVRALRELGWQHWVGEEPRLTYWQALAKATKHSQGPLLCALANDLDPAPGWLRAGLSAYFARFGQRGGLMGFAGDGHGAHHACHFLIGRAFLAELGGWPHEHYDHNFGDTELCERAQALGRYGKATRAVLNHLHAGRGLAPRDAVYDEGRRRWEQDKLTYQRRRAQWASA